MEISPIRKKIHQMAQELSNKGDQNLVYSKELAAGYDLYKRKNQLKMELVNIDKQIESLDKKKELETELIDIDKQIEIFDNNKNSLFKKIQVTKNECTELYIQISKLEKEAHEELEKIHDFLLASNPDEIS